ncbi:hypothetical protein K32_21560 [Kaistia sp. 32K]|uniref:hypothetical protein n=1 Tax=Kaistia sp. 32K TaxID=2795690 RepID=UPI0019154EFB|nr:hypothetical protein [Kaistia sp. 32K]BCP53539.1 hypothetical protein K32_21560 [Kaistia sp. 32K]
MITIPDGADNQRRNILPRLAFHGAAGLAAVACAALVGHFMMKPADNPRSVAPATAQIYELPDGEHPEEAAPTPDAAMEQQAAVTTPEPIPVAKALTPIPPKPLAKPSAAPSGGGSREAWEAIVNKALTLAPATQARPVAVRASASAPHAAPFDPALVGRAPAYDDVMPIDPLPNTPRVIEREGPTSIGDMAKTATTSVAATVVTQSSKMVDNLMRWSESAVSSVGLKRDRTATNDKLANP